MAADTLVLRDIHQPAAPPLWPPAPGWWLLLVIGLAVVAVLWWWRARQRRRREQLLVLFDASVDAAPTPSAQVAVISELLRRAARRHDPRADRLDGDAWLALLDAGARRPGFVTGPGRLLLDGGYRRDVDPVDVEAMRVLARARFLEWMARR
ncbi:DUF4381 domain-containing protein [Montanilutibacter psychrotolerans]|uniref:DUF4381 domain-containing protein n=1 Tax=Montanilutibacter psychrotolerans TaxID=1327343 RepID=A0A3M8SX13_9GAMM|nr:DUF4381 domain-containing protein [Lysobacter psychrotolerans]RNF85907.1 DUF4381 domain-containing protein [Lysobacter psychrotolerans]